MHTLDASALIYAWDNYPIEKFPDFWNWIELLISKNSLSIPKPAYDEVGHNLPECHEWVKNRDIIRIALNNDILQDASGFKSVLGIVNDNYHPKGVDEDDLLIIASAKSENMGLISEEAVQNNLPHVKAKYKIPAVCALPQVGVS